MAKTFELSGDFWGANHDLIGVARVEKIMAVRRAAKAAFPVSAGNAGNGGPSGDMFVVDVDEKVHGNFSAKATLSRESAQTEDENTFEKSAARCVPAEEILWI